jgi:glucose/arabinose dehydrogenase
MRQPARRLLAALAALVLLTGVAPSADAAPSHARLVPGGLETPWEVVLVPDGRTWVTERPCRVRSVGPGGALSTVLQGAPDVTCRKYLGLVVHPAFASNGLAYLYETYQAGSAARSRIVRLADRGGRLERVGVVLDGIGSDLSHDGGRMAFGPDGRLYVTTGDAHDPARPQDPQSLNGKILRLEAPATGATAPRRRTTRSPPRAATPVRVELGHRHPQGLAWDALGRLWETEHGPTGESHAPVAATCCRDEVNLIERARSGPGAPARQATPTERCGCPRPARRCPWAQPPGSRAARLRAQARGAIG